MQKVDKPKKPLFVYYLIVLAVIVLLNLFLFPKLNPVYYVVTGFRDALIYKHWFWERPLWTLYFWCFTIGAFLLL